MKTKERTSAIVPGTFDPVTKGHIAMIRRASLLFDEVTVLFAVNGEKNALFTLEERIAMMRQAICGLPNVKIDTEKGNVGDYCRLHGIDVIFKGLRCTKDYNYEEEMAQVNHMLAPETETVFWEATGENRHISSTMIRVFLSAGTDVSPWLPEGVTLPERIAKQSRKKVGKT